MEKNNLKKMISEMIIQEKQTLDYMNEFQKFAASKLKGKKLDGWKFSYDNMSGVFNFDKVNLYMVATPFWEGTEEIPIAVENEKTGDHLFDDVAKFPSTGDMNKDYKNYVKIMLKYIKNFNTHLR